MFLSHLHHHTKGFAQDNRCVALIASPLAVTMLLHGERASGTSARRRRERRLRSWAKHERMSIAIALAENLHHSRQKVEGNASNGLRAQKSARAAGCHPGVLKDPEVQWFKGAQPLCVCRVSFAGCFAVDRT